MNFREKFCEIVHHFGELPNEDRSTFVCSCDNQDLLLNCCYIDWEDRCMINFKCSNCGGGKEYQIVNKDE